MPDETPPAAMVVALKKHGAKTAVGGISLAAILGGLQIYHDVRDEIRSNRDAISSNRNVIRSNEILYVTVSDWINMERTQDEKTDEKIMALRQEIERLKAGKTIVFGGGESEIGGWEYGDVGSVGSSFSISRSSTNDDAGTVTIQLIPKAAYTVGTPK